MNSLADDYAAHGVGSIFLYTHEAHPGEHFPRLTSMAQKFEHAVALRDVHHVSRPILLDALDGACHRTYGGMPNMTWVFTKSGIPVYKSDWTDANSVRNELDYLTGVRERREAGEKTAPFIVHRLDYRRNDRELFYEGLARNGPKAVDEFTRFSEGGE